MLQKIILSLFTAWLGVSGSLTLPALATQAKFQLIGAAQAQSAGVTRNECDSPNAAVVSAKRDGNSAISNFRQDIQNENGELRAAGNAAGAPDQIYAFIEGRMNVRPQATDQQLLDGVIAQLRDAKNQRIVNSANSDSAAKLSAYYSAVRALGVARCDTYTAEVRLYNQTATNFNQLAQSTFPSNAATFSRKITDRFEDPNSQSGGHGEYLRRAKIAIEQAVTTFRSSEGKLNLATFKLLPEELTKLDPNAQPRNADGTAGTTVIDPGANGLDDLTSNKSDCGCKKVVKDEKSVGESVWNWISGWANISGLLCALPCLALTAMVQAYISVIDLAQKTSQGLRGSTTSSGDDTLNFSAGSEGTWEPATSPPTPGTSPPPSTQP